jgi:hypothetical protein
MIAARVDFPAFVPLYGQDGWLDGTGKRLSNPLIPEPAGHTRTCLPHRSA